MIGANWTGTYHVPARRLLPDVEVVAICTARPETAHAATDKQIIEKRFWNVDAMLAGTAFDQETAPILLMPLAALSADMARVIRTGAGDGSPSFAEAAHAHLAVEAAVESDMLEFAAEPRETSRLSCRIRLNAELDGLRMSVPAGRHGWRRRLQGRAE